MNEHTTKNATIDEDEAVKSRRKFLKQMACGSLLALGGAALPQRE